MRVLVTGCAGFIGYHICEKLLKANCTVTGIDNLNTYYDVQLKEDSAVASNNQQQPLLLRSWGGIRWTLDRALYHGGAPHHPHMSFMCDDTACWTCNVDDVSCANPGSFAVNGIFAWISPTDKTVDFNTMESSQD